MPITLYMEYSSPPSRAVMMTAEAIKLNLDLKRVDLAKLEQLKPEFVKINPQHTVPTLVDESTVIWDSHAIVTYLVSKYGRDDSLYPKDLKKRALVDQRLHFDNGSLFTYGRLFIKKCLSKRGRTLEQYEKDFMLDSYNLMENFLHQTQFMAGDQLTVADLSLITSVKALDIVLPVDASQFPQLTRWIERMEALPYYKKCNEEGMQALKGFIGVISDIVVS